MFHTPTPPHTPWEVHHTLSARLTVSVAWSTLSWSAPHQPTIPLPTVASGIPETRSRRSRLARQTPSDTVTVTQRFGHQQLWSQEQLGRQEDKDEDEEIWKKKERKKKRKEGRQEGRQRPQRTEQPDPPSNNLNGNRTQS
ncbi:hypothetical protein EX30DRAFT_345989 [Ascodesmis nigricans]|uniref:Uncharacterized protein n=1 Tax=Ascodesmis nigricans TaxID=341454 RepID=A0A4V3SJV6_9PEZI|nr:hypothetical protein EX30DRAFT_345989 [Ascodesmis nigricans]